MVDPGVNLVMTVIGFAVSTMFIVFVCTRLVCARIQFLSSRRSFNLYSRSDLSMPGRGLRGVEPLVISNFPTKKYKDPFFSAVEDAQCTVCLGEYHAEDTLRILPFCGHFFHTTCIDIWLQQHCTCPICRISIRELSQKRNLMQPMFSSAVRSPYHADVTSHSYLSVGYGGFSTRAPEVCRMETTCGSELMPGQIGQEAEESNTSLNDTNVRVKDRNETCGESNNSLNSFAIHSGC